MQKSGIFSKEISERRMTGRILFAVPCFNEAENIPALVAGFRRLAALSRASFVTELVFIDDASSDATQAAVQREMEAEGNGLEIGLLCHEKNLGLAGGLRTSFEYFSKRTSEDPGILACGLMDGDNSHNPGHIPEMASQILKGFDVVICSRFQKGSRTLGVVWWRQILSLGMSFLFRSVRNIPGARDYSCGYRLYSAGLCAKLWADHGAKLVIEESFACMVELLLRCHNAGALITETPMLLRYDLKKGASKMRFARTISGTLKILLRR
jgi:dolichol-phosphate mannosyltransferase